MLAVNAAGAVGCDVFLCLVMTSNSEVPEHLTQKEHNITSDGLFRGYSTEIR